ncbi:MAG: hypothetical protein WC043_04900 [Pseudobdellovibrionaceae bacterium]
MRIFLLFISLFTLSACTNQSETKTPQFQVSPQGKVTGETFYKNCKEAVETSKSEKDLYKSFCGYVFSTYMLSTTYDKLIILDLVDEKTQDSVMTPYNDFYKYYYNCALQKGYLVLSGYGRKSPEKISDINWPATYVKYWEMFYMNSTNKDKLPEKPFGEILLEILIGRGDCHPVNLKHYGVRPSEKAVIESP